MHAQAFNSLPNEKVFYTIHFKVLLSKTDSKKPMEHYGQANNYLHPGHLVHQPVVWNEQPCKPTNLTLDGGQPFWQGAFRISKTSRQQSRSGGVHIHIIHLEKQHEDAILKAFSVTSGHMASCIWGFGGVQRLSLLKK